VTTGWPEPAPAFRWQAETWGRSLRAVPLEPIAQHVFTTRELLLTSAAGWADALASIGARPDQLMRVKQVHGAAVRVIARGDVAAANPDLRPDADAVVSNVAGFALAVQVADCVPILMADRRSGAAGAVHAGWRGTCAGIARVAVEAMRLALGTAPADLVVAMGPSIGPDDYEVGESLVEAFAAAGHDRATISRWFSRRREGRLTLDLWTANLDLLVSAGVDPGHIHQCGLSTLAHADLLESYRARGEHAGRTAGIIRVPG
jgi:YfiH family protein